MFSVTDTSGSQYRVKYTSLFLILLFPEDILIRPVGRFKVLIARLRVTRT